MCPGRLTSVLWSQAQTRSSAAVLVSMTLRLATRDHKTSILITVKHFQSRLVRASSGPGLPEWAASLLMSIIRGGRGWRWCVEMTRTTPGSCCRKNLGNGRMGAVIFRRGLSVAVNGTGEDGRTTGLVTGLTAMISCGEKCNPPT